MKDLDSHYGESVKGVLDSGVRIVQYYFIRENTLPHLLLLWGGCPKKPGLGELGGLAGRRVEQ